MKLFRLFGLATFAAMATVALLAAGNAAATELCKVEESSCEGKNLYEDGTAIKASSTKAVFETSLGTITCTSSTLEGENTAPAGDPVPATFAKLTFGSCKVEESSCTVEASELPYYGEIEHSGENIASLDLRGDVNPMTVLLKCSGKKEINCTLKDEEMGLELKGGKPAQVIASKESFEKASGASCPEKTSLTATYSITAPEPLDLGNVPTTLCKIAPEGTGACQIGKEYSGGIQGYLPGPNKAKLVITGGATVTCTEAPIAGSFEPTATGEISSFEFKSGGSTCASTFGGNPGVTVTMAGLPAKLSSFDFINGWTSAALFSLNGKRNLKLEIAVPGSTTCVYLLILSFFEVQNPTGGLPMELVSPHVEGRRASGLEGVCGTYIELEGLWYIETNASNELWASIHNIV